MNRDQENCNHDKGVPTSKYICASKKFVCIAQFHCDAKLFALGTGVGLDPQRHTFASPNAKDTNMLVSKNAKTPNLKFASPNVKL